MLPILNPSRFRPRFRPGKVESGYGALRPIIISYGMAASGWDPTGWDLANTIGVSQHYAKVVKDIPDGRLIGSQGAGPCVIAVVSIPSTTRPGKYDVVVSHFEAQDKPNALWSLIGGLPAGSHVALTGGFMGENDIIGGTSKELLATIASVAFRSGVTIDGYFYGNGLWVDNALHYYAYQNNVERKQ